MCVNVPHGFIYTNTSGKLFSNEDIDIFLSIELIKGRAEGWTAEASLGWNFLRKDPKLRNYHKTTQFFVIRRSPEAKASKFCQMFVHKSKHFPLIKAALNNSTDCSRNSSLSPPRWLWRTGEMAVDWSPCLHLAGSVCDKWACDRLISWCMYLGEICGDSLEVLLDSEVKWHGALQNPFKHLEMFHSF